MATILPTVALVLCLTIAVDGSCFGRKAKQATGEYGTVRRFCRIKDLGLEITEGDVVISYDTCYKYTCNFFTLEGCGFGYRAGIEVNPGCITENDLCGAKYVQDPDSSDKCEETPTGPPLIRPSPPTTATITPPSANITCELEGWGILEHLVCSGTSSVTLSTIIIMSMVVVVLSLHRYFC